MTSGVETRHPTYERMEYEWRQLRDTIQGMSAVKRSGDLYLPIPAAMIEAQRVAGLPNDSGVEINTTFEDKSLKTRAPWSHPNIPYSAYLQRARFPDITSSSLRGLIGISTKKMPEIELPAQLEHLVEKATLDGLSLKDLFKKAIREVLSVGRFNILVDIDKAGKIVLVPYSAESYINWKESSSSKLTLSVLEENSFGSIDDEFSQDAMMAHRVLRIDKDDKYETQVYLDGKASGKITPSFQGVELDRIPLSTMNAMNVGSDIGVNPMIGISDISISIYQKEADMAQSEFLTCSPMLVLIGVDPDDAPNVIGSSVSYALSSDTADAKYVEPNSNCLSHMTTRISNLMDEAGGYGAALLGADKKAAESTETMRMKQEAKGATLKGVVRNVESGIKRALMMAAEWVGANSEDVVFEANIEFSDLKLSAQEQAALLQSWMNRGISQDTYLYNLKAASIIPESRTIEEEKDLIDSAKPMLAV